MLNVCAELLLSAKRRFDPRASNPHSFVSLPIAMVGIAGVAAYWKLASNGVEPVAPRAVVIALPPIEQSKNLKFLHLKGTNQLCRLPAEIGQFQALQELSLSNHQLSILPDEIGQLQALWRLDLSHNQFETWPDPVNRLQALTILLLAHNQIKALPETIGPFEKLANLTLSNNQLKVLPISIGQLQTLWYLHLDHNQLKEAPDAVWLLPRHCTVDMRQNLFNSDFWPPAQFQQMLRKDGILDRERTKDPNFLISISNTRC